MGNLNDAFLLEVLSPGREVCGGKLRTLVVVLSDSFAQGFVREAALQKTLPPGFGDEFVGGITLDGDALATVECGSQGSGSGPSKRIEDNLTLFSQQEDETFDQFDGVLCRV